MAKCDISVIQNALGIQQTGPRTVIVPADPITWSENTSYEYLTLVASANFGKSYISKRDVPSGTPLTDTDYWIPAADYNAQLADIQRQLATANAALSKIQASGTTMLAFGDSFGVNTVVDGSAWPELVAKHYGLTLDNYCIGGHTWPFNDGLAAAREKYATQDQIDSIAFAIAYGGINSTVFGQLDPTLIETFITNFNTYFPGVKLYIAPLNICSPLYSTHPKAFHYTTDGAGYVYGQLRTFDGDFTLLEYSTFFNTGAGNLWKSDLLHPNVNGSRAIANSMISAMNGNYNAYQTLWPIGTWFSDPTKISVDEQGFVTGDGIYLPKITIKQRVSSQLYFAGYGLPVPDNMAPVTCLNVNSSTITKIDGIKMGYNNTDMQFFIDISTLSYSEGYAVIPHQFIPFATRGYINYT